ncbi:MAG TPA: MBL fold metallo-hydrolase [Stellaceae bacterium]|jgi:ribonuclease BN (tRNA processing enzyme)|nr:MBL fold metallo-hydrolase [Stellaceae bacterium]
MEKTGWRMSRRGLLTGVAAAPALTLTLPGTAEAAMIETTIAQTQKALEGAKGTKLVLLGTGAGPAPDSARHMASHVMVHNGDAYILDCGLGVTRQFARIGLPWRSIKGIFITHHHPDHNGEYGPLLLYGWVRGMQPQALRAYGPTSMTQMTQDYLTAMKTTIGFWAKDFHMPPLEKIETHDLDQAGPVMQDGNVKVASTLVQHPPVTPAFGYRFDFPDRSIAFSGDTVPLESVVELAKGADILVHEAIDMAAMQINMSAQIARTGQGNIDIMMNHMKADHSPTEEVGRIATEAGVKTLVLSHLQPGVSDARWRADASKHFKGKIIVGRDLMVI